MNDSLLAIETRSLTKSYGRAAVRGIVDVDLSIEPGQVVGLVGANGAGKTTLMRTLLDFIRPTSGSLRVFGLDSVHDSLALRKRTAYLPGELVLPRQLTGHQTLDRYSFARPSRNRRAVTSLADRLGLDLTRKVGDLSKGNKQKVGLVLALSARADLLVLDEPTSGLDPLLQREFSALVREAASEGTTILLSSHVMSEVEHIAGKVALIREGRLASFDDVSAIRDRARRQGRVRAEPGYETAVEGALRALPNVSTTSSESGLLAFDYSGGVDSVIKALAQFPIASLDLTEADLEDAFFSSPTDDPSGAES